MLGESSHLQLMRMSAIPLVRLRLIPLVLLCLLCRETSVWALDPNRQISQYAHNAWTIRDGYLSATPYSIAQTADGYLWIGTSAGLLRFDGVRFDASSPPVEKQPAYASAGFGTLLGARDGSLWIYSRPSQAGTGTLSRWTGSELLSYPPPARPFGGIRLTRGGDLWSSQPLCQIGGAKPRCYGTADGVPDTRARRLAEDADGHFWLSSDDGLVRWSPGDPGATIHYPLPGLKAHTGIFGVGDIAVAPDGTVWAGIEDPGAGLGLQHLVHGKWTSAIVPGVDSSKWDVNRLLVDREGALWIGTGGQGLFRLYGQRLDHFGSTDGLSGDAVTGLYEDREGNIWVLTYRGIDKFRDTRVVVFSKRDGLCSEEADSLLVAHEGALWVGGEHTGLSALQGDRIACLPAAKWLPGNQVTSLFEDQAHQLWVGVDQKMGIYEHGRFTPIKKADGTSLGMIASIAEDVDHNIWMVSGNRHRALFRIENRHVSEEPIPGMPEPHEVAADPAGGIWLGLMNGDLARYRNGHAEFVHFNHSENLWIAQIAVGPDGSVLAASASGLLGWKNGKSRTMTSRNGLPCGAVSAFLADDSGSLWLQLPCGFVEITAAQLQKWWADSNTVLQLHVLDALDGMQPGAGWFQSKTAKTRDGRLWFGGNVLQMIDPARRSESPVVPLAHVEHVIADQKHYTLGPALELPALTRSIEIDYTAPVFAIPQRVRFRYMLEGSDREWQDVGTRREALYTNLGPGHYRFRVAASNNDGVWSTNDASVAFTIAPAFYQTRWFYAACALACIALLTVLYRARVRQVSAQVRGRMEARLAERERIARDLHDTLLQSVQGLMFRLHAVRELLPGRPAEAAQALKGALQCGDEAIAEGRAAVQDLRVPTAAPGDLSEAIMALGPELLPEGGAQQPSYHVLVEGKPRPLMPLARDESYRIAREAVRNAVQHARARRIEAELAYGDKSFCVRIRDDGIGVDAGVLGASRSGGHWGIPGMHERAKSFGAHLEIWGESGAGTELLLEIPATVAYARDDAREASAIGRGEQGQ
jgi:signal transduction histidine kinase/ligand-binding sensor domain-containing protein